MHTPSFERQEAARCLVTRDPNQYPYMIGAVRQWTGATPAPTGHGHTVGQWPPYPTATTPAAAA